MRKGFLLVAIILWATIAVSIIGGIVFGISGGFDNMTRVDVLLKSEDVPVYNIRNVIVDGSHQAIEIIKTNEDYIKFKQYSNRKVSDERLFSVTVSGENVNVYFKNRWQFNFFDLFVREILVIEIPEKFTENLSAKTNSGGIKTKDELTLKNIELKSSSGGIHIYKNLTSDSINIVASSGGIRVEGDIFLSESGIFKTSSGGIKFFGAVDTGNLKAETNSGGIHFTMGVKASDNVEVRSSSGGIKFSGPFDTKNLKAETSSGGFHSVMELKAKESIELRSSSGGINIEDTVTSKSFNAKTNSGGIRLEDVNVDTYYLKTTSGGVAAKNISGSGDAETTSGGIKLSLKNPKDNVNLSASSGGITLKLEPSLQFNLEAHTNSGNIYTNFPITSNGKNNDVSAKIGDNPIVNIDAHTNSGSVRIEN